MSISNVDIKNLDSEEGSVALRDFFSELFAEQVGSNCSIATEDDDDDNGSNSCASVSLSSDEETASTRDHSLMKNTPKINNRKNINSNNNNNINQDSNQDRIENNHDLNSNTNHTRRGRFRRSRGLKPQRPSFALSQDNARGLPSLSKHSSGELRVSSYHCNSMSSTSLHKSSAPNKYNRNSKKNRNSLSASAHSLGSRTGISDTSVNIWRKSLNRKNSERGMQRGRQMIRSNHRDSSWSTSGTDIPKSGRSGNKTYDFGFVNDSLHMRNVLRRKNLMNIRQDRTNSNHSRDSYRIHLNDSSSIALKSIESAVRLVSNPVFSDDSSEGEEFYEDDVSLSSFTASHSPSSKAESSITTNGSSIDFGNKYKTKAKEAKSLYSTRDFPTRAKSSGHLPQLPTRTRDDFFELAECFEPLKDKSSDNESLMGTTRRRTMSDDVSMNTMYSFGSKSTISTGLHYESPKVATRRRSDPFGRWAATVTTKVDSPKNRDSALRCPPPPRRVPSLSGELLNNSKDPSEPSTTDCESSDCESSECETAETFGFDPSYDGHDSFAHCRYDDSDSLAATIATTGSSSPDSGSSSQKLGTTSASSYEEDDYKILLSDLSKAYNSHHRRMSIPESLRKLPQHSFHVDENGNNSSTTRSNTSMTTTTSSSISSTSGAGILRHPGKSLVTANKSRFR